VRGGRKRLSYVQIILLTHLKAGVDKRITRSAARASLDRRH